VGGSGDDNEEPIGEESLPRVRRQAAQDRERPRSKVDTGPVRATHLFAPEIHDCLWQNEAVHDRLRDYPFHNLQLAWANANVPRRQTGCHFERYSGNLKIRANVATRAWGQKYHDITIPCPGARMALRGLGALVADSSAECPKMAPPMDTKEVRVFK
jgi:hypothetical protein